MRAVISMRRTAMTDIAERVRRVARRFQRPVRCTACAFPAGAGRRLITGPNVYICECCIGEATARTGATDQGPRCSFCGHQGVRLARVWPTVAICVDCVELSRRILRDDDQRSRGTT